MACYFGYSAGDLWKLLKWLGRGSKYKRVAEGRGKTWKNIIYDICVYKFGDWGQWVTNCLFVAITLTMKRAIKRYRMKFLQYSVEASSLKSYLYSLPVSYIVLPRGDVIHSKHNFSPCKINRNFTGHGTFVRICAFCFFFFLVEVGEYMLSYG